MLCVMSKQSEKYVRETSLQTPRSVKKKGKRCYRHQRRHSPVLCGKTIVKKAPPLEVHSRGSHFGANGYPKGL